MELRRFSEDPETEEDPATEADDENQVLIERKLRVSPLACLEFERQSTFLSYCLVFIALLLIVNTFIESFYPTASATDPRPRISSSADFSYVPSGVLLNQDLSEILKIDGCWKECYHATYGQGSDEEVRLDSLCRGEWIFVGTLDGASTVLVGAFGKHDEVLVGAFANNTSSFSLPSSACMHVGEDFAATGVESNDVFWFSLSCRTYGYQSFGFSPDSQVTLSWNYGFIDTGYSQSCESSLSWSLSASKSDSSVGCVLSHAADRYTKLILENTCAVHPIAEGKEHE